MKDFVLAPWEYVGAGFDYKAHAEARLEIGGKKRNFLLKMREGVVFFKEPSRAQVFAIPQIFENDLAADGIGLISAWQREVETENYGAFVAKRDYFEKLPVRGQFLMIVCPNGSGWMKEHFDAEWFSLPGTEKPRVYELWNPKVLEVQVKDLLPRVKASLLQRVIEPSIRQINEARWIGGSDEEFSALIIATTCLLLLPGDFVASAAADALSLHLRSHSAFAAGEIEGYWFKNACRTPHFGAVWSLIEREFHFVGVKWSEGGEQVDSYPRNRVEKVFQAGLERWGANWRGNWAPQRASFTATIPLPGQQSAHEKLEALLLLRNWLSGKMPDAQIEALLQKASI